MQLGNNEAPIKSYQAKDIRYEGNKLLPFELLSDVPRAIKKAYEALNLKLTSNIESKQKKRGMMDFGDLGDFLRNTSKNVVNKGLRRIKLSENGIDKNR